MISKWDARFIRLAREIGTWSPCVRRSVGCVLVRDKHVLSTGFNGPPRGAPHRTSDTCVRIGIPSGERADVVCCAHAEANAVAIAALHGVRVEGATAYVTVRPCATCARILVNAGVARVVHDEGYADEVAPKVFAESGVPCEVAS